MPDIEDALEAALENPLEASIDGNTVKQHSLKDLIEALKYIGRNQAGRSASLPIRLTSIVPAGPAD